MDEDERCRLLRDREMLFAVLDELLTAHAGMATGGSASRWTAALKQAEQVRDAAKQQAGDKHPYAIFYCEREGDHHGQHEILPHAMLVIHGSRGEVSGSEE